VKSGGLGEIVLATDDFIFLLADFGGGNLSITFKQEHSYLFCLVRSSIHASSTRLPT